jgi:hypothetical protein
VKRRSSAPEPVEDLAPAKLGGKGRPTPQRRDIGGARGPLSAPKTRKVAAARQTELARRQRDAAKVSRSTMTPAQRRAALRSGDILARRDQGETRRLARDYVDSHRLFSNYLLLLFPIMILSYVAPRTWAWVVQILVLAVFVSLLIEWYAVGRRIRRLALERHGEAQGSAMSIGFYAGSRAYLPRRWRLPAPQVGMGDPI